MKKIPDNVLDFVSNTFKNGPVVFFNWRSDENWSVEFVSDNVKELTGYNVKDFINGKIYFKEIIHSEDISRVFEEVEYAKNNNRENITHQPYRIIKKNGDIIWIKDFTNIRSEDNKIIGFTGYVYDITDLINSQKEAKENQAKLKFAIDGSGLGYWDWDVTENKVHYSKIWKSMLGYKENEIDDSFSTWERLIHPDDKENAENAISNYFNNKEKIYVNEHRLQTKSGDYKWILAKGKILEKDNNGNPLRMIGTHTDMTEYYKIRESLKHSEKMLKLIINSTPDLICLKDDNNRWLLANNSFLNRFNIDENNYKGKTDSEIEKDYPIIREFCVNCNINSELFWKENKNKRIEIEFVINGELRYYDIVLIPHKMSDYNKLMIIIARDITDIKSVNKELEENQKRLSGILSSQLDLIVRVDNQNKFTYVNDKYCEVFGMSKDELIGFAFTPLVHEDDIKTTLEELKKLNKPPFRCYIEQRALTVYGWRWFAWEDYAIRNENGDIIEIQAVGRDITEQKNAEEKLKETERRYKGIFNNTSDAIFIVEVINRDKYKYVTNNPSHQNLTGIDESIVAGKAPEDLLPEEMAKQVIDNYNKCYDSKEAYTYEEVLDLPAGKKFWLTTLIPIKDDNNKLYLIAGISRDITNRIEMEEILRESEEKFRQLAENIDLVFWLREKGKIIYISPAYHKLWGKTPESLYEDPDSYLDSFVQEDKIKILEQLSKRNENPESDIDIELRIIRDTDKKIRWVHIKTFPITNQDGKIIRTAGIASDITENKEYENALKKATESAEKANISKSEFLANMSHEIRTPMNSILGFSEILLNEIDEPKAKQHINTILASGKTLLSLINDILDLSKIEAGKLELSPESFSLKNLLNEVQLIFNHKINQKNLDFKIEYDNNIPEIIYTDDIRIRQILFNIVGNAIKFTEKGSVKISAKLLKKNDDKIDFDISVKDTGIGIPENQFNLIFESFQQQSGQSSRKYGGTGLGLAISKRLMELLNGEILLESKVGKGSKFSLRFYNVHTSNLSSNKTDDFKWGDKLPIFKKQNLLVVDDISENREVVINYLNKHNLNIIETDSGENSIELVKQYDFNLILMDLRMIGISGITAAEKIKSINNNIIIIAFTASTANEKEILDSNNFDGLLRKPVLKNNLLKTLTEFLDYDIIKKGQKEEFNFNEINLSDLEKDELRKIFNEGIKKDIEDNLEIVDLEIINSIKEKLKYLEKSKNQQLNLFYKNFENNINSFDLEKISQDLKILQKISESL